MGRAGEAGEIWDCGSRECGLLELPGRLITEPGVQTAAVKPADPLDDGQLELSASAPDAVGDQLGLEAIDEALGQRVVERIADRPIDASTP
jgi:hypothetical protein